MDKVEAGAGGRLWQFLVGVLAEIYCDLWIFFGDVSLTGSDNIRLNFWQDVATMLQPEAQIKYAI